METLRSRFVDVNLWENKAELELRREEARQLAKGLWPSNTFMERRLINLAQGLSKPYWDGIKRAGNEVLEIAMDGMSRMGIPLDQDPDLVITDASKTTPAGP